MPTQTITLTQDQADDLRKLLSYAEILEARLLHAPDGILDELARFAYLHRESDPQARAWLTVLPGGWLSSRRRSRRTPR